MKSMQQIDESFVDDCFSRVAAIFYGESVQFKPLEEKLGELKNGGPLTYEHLMYIEDPNIWQTFSKWYQWPERKRIEKDLEATNDIFKCLKTDQHIKQEEQKAIDTRLFRALIKIFQSVSLVSILLRLIDPNHYGMYSYPVAYYIKSPRGANAENEYLNYQDELRKYRIKFGLENVAYVEMFLWTLVKDQQKRLDGGGNEQLLEFEEELNNEVEIKEIANCLPARIINSNELDRAKLFKDMKLYDLAARSAGIYFEEIINKKCMEKNIYIDPAYGYDNLAYRIDKLCEEVRRYPDILHKVRDTRNDVSHPLKRHVGLVDVQLMMNIIGEIEKY